MAIYYSRFASCSAGDKKSAVHASAYRARTKLVDERGNEFDYTKRNMNAQTRRNDLVYSSVMIPPHAPPSFVDRQTLWQSVERVETYYTGNKAKYSREIEFALPREWNDETRIDAVKQYARWFVDKGMCVDMAIHDKNDGNPHAHFMLTTRPIEKTGEWAKRKGSWQTEYVLKNPNLKDEKGEIDTSPHNRIPVIDTETGMQKLGKKRRRLWKRRNIERPEWETKQFIEDARKHWADVANEHLPLRLHLDHRSYKRQASAEHAPKQAQIKKGWYNTRLGEKSRIAQINRLITRIPTQRYSIEQVETFPDNKLWKWWQVRNAFVCSPQMRTDVNFFNAMLNVLRDHEKNSTVLKSLRIQRGAMIYNMEAKREAEAKAMLEEETKRQQQAQNETESVNFYPENFDTSTMADVVPNESALTSPNPTKQSRKQSNTVNTTQRPPTFGQNQSPGLSRSR
jgi:hypothetical protein